MQKQPRALKSEKAIAQAIDNISHELESRRRIKLKLKKIIFDTNIWRYIGDAGAAQEIARIAKKQNVVILVAPSVMYEVLRTSDPALRERQAKLIAMPLWKKLMPDAFSECKELRNEIQLFHPEWITGEDTALYKRSRYDWIRKKGGFWERARDDSSAESKVILSLEGNTIEAARTIALKNREFQNEKEWKHEKILLDDIFMNYQPDYNGRRYDQIEPWRVTALDNVTDVLNTSRSAYSSWLGPYIDVSIARKSNRHWVEFWLCEASKLRLKRFWLRWAFEYLQMFRRVNDGTPCDSQLGAYLTESEFICSADRIFLNIVEICRQQASFEIAQPIRVAGGSKGVDELMLRIENM